MAIKFEKKQSATQKSAKKQPKFNQNKPKKKQPASLKENANPQKDKPKFAGKPQGWQHCSDSIHLKG